MDSRSFQPDHLRFFMHTVFTSHHVLVGAAVSIVEMLYSTNIIAIVGKRDRYVFVPKRLTIWDTNNETSRMDISFNTPITHVKLNKRR